MGPIFFHKKSLIVLLFALSGLNILTFFYALYVDYHIYDWFDIILHLWGGFTVGLAYCIYFRSPLLLIKNRLVLMLSIVGVSVIIGVGWEWFEWLHDRLFGQARHLLTAQAGIADALKDLLNDMIGGVLIALLFIQQKKLRK